MILLLQINFQIQHEKILIRGKIVGRQGERQRERKREGDRTETDFGFSEPKVTFNMK